ncbi:prepilin-type N-terminal cleavage/methylation domain-containing protein [Shewanella litoralis]|uniref:MSHA biogenesis protein MshD n=1 Tax=Shewanella litoralis TaxID=2282700 RepID=A0ABQ2R935_9GAMM|nr:prepilin-type N-terminal cleavage/methylation domain-containing protein [Shewanella litoralis]GGQ15121.1 MSHA biogenesis protein MshD [Shewanella litoralis]
MPNKFDLNIVNFCKQRNITARRINAGFTLIELVIGMMVIGIGIVMLTSMLFPQADRAAATLQRVKSAELAHSVMNEIWGKRYDQNTNANGGIPACNASAGLDCSYALATDGTPFLGPDGESRDAFNDVDDYHGLDQDDMMLDSSQTYAQAYPNYEIQVSVTYLDSVTKAQKLISVDVTTPSNEVITYQAVRSNY